MPCSRGGHRRERDTIETPSCHPIRVTMTAYWCRFLDSRGRAISSEKMVCANDAEAVAKARAIVQDEHLAGFELWDGSRRVDIEHIPEPNR